jgi:8-amino-7-oxononanoate synthase
MSPFENPPIELNERLAELQGRGLKRRLPDPVVSPGPRVVCRGRELLNLCSNDYLGLSTHPEVIEASVEALRASGCGATGSRLLSGNLELHERLERELARFKGLPSALLFNTGFAANTGTIEALAESGDLIVSDKLNHASLIDGARASEAESRFFRHGDLARAEELLSAHRRESPAHRRWLAIDGVFSMDGDVVELPAVLALCQRTSTGLILDEAHATGVLGATGRGSFEHFGVDPARWASTLPGLVLMGTLGKALGNAGAFVATDAVTREWLVNRARPFIYSTALPPAVLGGALGALAVLEREPSRVRELARKSAHFRSALRAAGIRGIQDAPTPIVPVPVGDAVRAVEISARLEESGIRALAIRPPTVPPGTARIRCSVMATHEDRDLARAATEIARA